MLGTSSIIRSKLNKAGYINRREFDIFFSSP